VYVPPGVQSRCLQATSASTRKHGPVRAHADHRREDTCTTSRADRPDLLERLAASAVVELIAKPGSAHPLHDVRLVTTSTNRHQGAIAETDATVEWSTATSAPAHDEVPERYSWRARPQCSRSPCGPRPAPGRGRQIVHVARNDVEHLRQAILQDGGRGSYEGCSRSPRGRRREGQGSSADALLLDEHSRSTPIRRSASETTPTSATRPRLEDRDDQLLSPGPRLERGGGRKLIVTAHEPITKSLPYWS